MEFRPFIGGSYQSQAFSADQESTVNWYVEYMASPGATSRMILLPVPGVEPVSVLYDGVGRGHYYQDGREFAVIGNFVYEIDVDGGHSSFGQITLTTDKETTPIFIDGNGDLGGQLLFVHDKGAGYADITAAVPVFTSIAALAGKGTIGGYLDGYGLCLDSKTSTLYISALGDFSSWTTGTDFAQRSLAADPWVSMIVVGRYIWLIGEETTEIWQDVGSRFPFAPIVNQVINYGTPAKYSPAKVGSNVCWLAQDKAGRLCVVRAGGVQPEIISHPGLEAEMQQYSSISDARGDAYSWNGHEFYLIHFDGDNITWCWDSTTGLWHQRGTWNQESAQFLSWSPRHFVRAFNEVRSLDRMVSVPPDDVDSANTGSFVYKLSENFVADVNGLPIRRVRRSPAIVNEDKRVRHNEFQVLMDSGIGPNRDSIATVALTAQQASITETTLFTTGTSLQSYVVEWDFVVTTTTTDYALNGTLYWYVDGVKKGHYFGSIDEMSDRLRGSISIRPDPNTVVSYVVTYTSTVGTMEYSVDLAMYIPGADDPQVMLRWSDDGGKNWSNEHWVPAGKVGEYGTRVNWHRLGTGRRRVFEVVVSDSIPWRLVDAYLDAEPLNT